MKTIIAVIGANGFVGSEICKAVDDSEHHLCKITRNSPHKSYIEGSDIVIHSANPAGRYMAENYPTKDFEETVEKTAKFLEMSKGKRFVLISSLSCRTQLDTNYGRNRRACELMTLQQGGLVIRLGPMFGGKRKKDMLHDILSDRDVHIGADSRYAYVSVAWNAKQVVDLSESSLIPLVELGARDSVRLGDIANYFGSKSEFLGEDEHQEPDPNMFWNWGPTAAKVYDYAQKEMSEMCQKNWSLK